MTTEEKAKAYDGVLDRIKSFADGTAEVPMNAKDIAEYLVPELAESEDERIRKAIISFLEQSGYGGVGECPKAKMIAWLEKQKEQKPVEWSEEDEKNIYFLTRLIELYIKDGRYETGDGTVTKPEIIKMLKSLRPSWKPSEEQMTKLHAVAYGCPDKYDEKILFSLYNDLKKLKGDEK